jgi:CSLREA domain-containing protein
MTRPSFSDSLFLFLFCALLLLRAAWVPAVHAAGASLVVNTTSDADNGSDGVCSLREAITAANNNADYNECIASGTYGADTITFSVSGTITLTASLPAIDDDMTIDGSANSASIIINGDDTYRVMQVNSGKTVTLHALTIENGKGGNCGLVLGCGGGIWNNGGTLSVSDSTFSDNSASCFFNNACVGYGGAIYNEGALVIADSSFTNNTVTCSPVGGECRASGGGIYNTSNSTLTISKSIFSNNRAYCGVDCLSTAGAIDNSGTATIINSAFHMNNGNDAGAIWNHSGTLTVIASAFSDNISNTIANAFDSVVNIANSTFSHNTASTGSDIYNNGTLTVTNSTFDSNTVPSIVAANGTTTLRNTIIANSASSDCMKLFGTLIADGYNIDTDGSCDNATTKTSAQINLLALADNGGPTQTIALGSGSAAIDAGDDSVCRAAPVSDQDQRGVARPQSAHCDVGAFEASFITGQKFHDANGDRVKNGSDGGLSGWIIQLQDTLNNVLDSTTTDASGNYTLTVGALPFTYRVREVQQPGWLQMTANPPDLALTVTNPSASNILFGNTDVTDLSIVQRYKFTDDGSLAIILKVKNIGANIAAGVVMSDTIPLGWKYVSVRASTGSCRFNSASRAVTCKLGSLNADARAKITLMVKAVKSASHFSNCAAVTTTTLDIDMNNNESCVSKP